MHLTATQEKYLRAVYDLTLDERETQVSRIAEQVGVSRASASVAVQWLERNGLIVKRRQRRVALTETGSQTAALSYGRREILCDFLVRVLGVPAEMAAMDAEALEPLVSVRTLCAFCGHARRRACAQCEQPCQTLGADRLGE